MSLIAIISDIHGNIDALEAVLEDIDQHNTDIVASWRALMEPIRSAFFSR